MSNCLFEATFERILEECKVSSVAVEIVRIKLKLKFSLSVPQTSTRRAAKRPWRNSKYVRATH